MGPAPTYVRAPVSRPPPSWTLCSDVILTGQVALARWALAEGCPRDDGGGITMAHVAAFDGHREILQGLRGEGASR